MGNCLHTSFMTGFALLASRSLDKLHLQLVLHRPTTNGMQHHTWQSALLYKFMINRTQLIGGGTSSTDTHVAVVCSGAGMTCPVWMRWRHLQQKA